MSSQTEADALEELQSADERIRQLRSELEDADLESDEIDDLVDAYHSVEAVLDRWEERATDWDDFQGYVEFRNDLAETLESIPDDVPERDAFVAADSHVKTSGVSKSLDTSDFEAARSALAPVRSYVETYEALESAREQRRQAYRRAKRRVDELEERIGSLQRLLELGEADLEAPIEQLRGPISTYNEAVRDDFETFRRGVPAREFLSFVERAARTPLVGYETPPAELLEYVRTRPAGDRSVDELLEYAEYSSSKLAHYVEDADLLKRRVATNRTYLERLSADPLCIEWPPKPADILWFRTAELVSLVGRFADEPTVTTLREIRSLTRRREYERLRRAAEADAELTDDERRRLRDGAVETELSAARAELDRLEDALADYDY
jgi:tetratricopeptide (TPR) repeat protein